MVYMTLSSGSISLAGFRRSSIRLRPSAFQFSISVTVAETEEIDIFTHTTQTHELRTIKSLKLLDELLDVLELFVDAVQDLHAVLQFLNLKQSMQHCL